MFQKVIFISIFVLTHIFVVFATDAPIDYSCSPATYGEGARDDMVDWSSHPCKRECTDDGPALTCRYGLTVELYTSMSKACFECPFNLDDCSRPHCVPADGGSKVLAVANRQLPGLSIEVCKGDRLLIDVKNGMSTETTSIHWHGLHQRGSNFMDGVPYISQCPILPGQTFRYDFVANTVGTSIWHSHIGEQKTDGLFGNFIVRQPPKSNGQKDLYDHDEHVILINEWMKNSGPHSFLLSYHNGVENLPHTILVNGLGRYNGSIESQKIPVPLFEVEKDQRYRFRVSNIGSVNCAIYVSVDNHTMLVISTDGADIKPVEAKSIRLLSGERYDFVLSADQDIDNYWIRFTGSNICQITNAQQFAILRYKGAANVEPSGNTDYDVAPYKRGVQQVNPRGKGTESSDAICIASLNSLDDSDDAIKRTPDHQFYLTYNFHGVNDDSFHRKNLYDYDRVPEDKQSSLSQYNNISFKMPSFPLQTQHEHIKPDHFCNETTVTNCANDFCECTHVLQVKLNSVVELVLIDLGDPIRFDHPNHIHGHYFRVVAMQAFNDTVTEDRIRKLDAEGKIHRKLDNAPMKDTVIVPSGGFTIVRFHANNPGYWFFHCHFDEHTSFGMALVFKVGEHEQFPKVPENFPKC